MVNSVDVATKYEEISWKMRIKNLQNWDVTRKCSYFMALYGGLNQHVGLSLSSTISEHVNLAIKLGMDMGFTRAKDRDSSTKIMESDTNIEIFCNKNGYAMNGNSDAYC